MPWFDQYHQRLTTADNAVQLVRSGHRVWIHPGSGAPTPIIEALLRRAPGLRNVEL
ncbi:MAG: hypothetical protein SFV54_22655 [Bryobacteraceae bacterium]|nr:hypothetical protein [Bryobacteraceae bacterium]